MGRGFDDPEADRTAEVAAPGRGPTERETASDLPRRQTSLAGEISRCRGVEIGPGARLGLFDLRRRRKRNGSRVHQMGGFWPSPNLGRTGPSVAGALPPPGTTT